MAGTAGAVVAVTGALVVVGLALPFEIAVVGAVDVAVVVAAVDAAVVDYLTEKPETNPQMDEERHLAI